MVSISNTINKQASRNTEASDLTLDKAIQILSNDGGNKGPKRIIAGVGQLMGGKFGAYLKMENGKNIGLKKLKISEDKFLKMTDDEIKALLS